MTRRHDRERGASTVETALAFPLLLLVLMGSMSVLWVLAARSALDHGARLGARYAGVTTTATGIDYPSEHQVRDYVDARVALFAVDHVDVCYYNGLKPTPAQFGDTTKCRNQPDAPNQRVAVRVRHDVPDVFGMFTTVLGLGNHQSVTGGEARVE